MEDEFGDLYDDVAVQASPAITSLAASVSSPVAESYSEDDDLRIVLNEEVCVANTNGRSHGAGAGTGASNGKGVYCEEDAGAWDLAGGEDGEIAGCGGGGSTSFPVYKRGRPYSASFPGNAKWAVGSMPCSSSSVYWGQGSSVGSSAAPYGGGFWLPRFRTILDVNVDAFEEKRWRFPGADVSDFFNFGLGENAWKEYCSSMAPLFCARGRSMILNDEQDQIRQRSYTRRQSSIPVHTSSKLPQACEFGSRQERVAEEDTAKDVILTTSTGSSVEELELPNGQAIQIEESTFERQPTMDLSQPRMSDSDVIIEIKVQDCDDNWCDLFKESDHLERTKLGLLEGKDVGLSHDKDDNLAGFSELDEESRGRKYFSHDEDSRSGADACYPRKMKDQISMDGSEAVRTVEKTEEEAVIDKHDASQDLIETDSSISGKIHFSPTVSCSGSETESSIDGFCNIPEESPCRPRMTTIQVNLRESVASDGGSPQSLSAIRESSSVRRYASDENSIQERQKHQTDRIQRRISPKNYNVAYPKFMHRSMSPARRCKLKEELPGSSNHYDSHLTDRVQTRISPIDYEDAPRKSTHQSMSPAHRCKLNEELLASSNHYKEYFSHQTDRVQRRNSSENYNDDDASPKSTHRSMSPARCRSYFSYRTRRDDYYDYGQQGLAVKHCDDIYANHPQRRLHVRFEDEMKLCGSAHLDEEIFDGRRLRLKNRDDKDRYWYNEEGRLEPAYSMRFAGKSDRFKARDIHLDEIHGCQLMKNDDSSLLDHEDNLGKEKYRGFIRSRCRRDFVAGSLCREMEDGYDRENSHYLTSWSNGELNISSKQWLQGRLSPRSDVRESQLSSGFSDHRRRVIEESGWKRGRLGVINGFPKTEDDIVYPDGGGPLRRRKYDHQLNAWSDAHDELGANRPDDVRYFEKDSCCGTKFSRHQKIYASRCSNVDPVSNELQFKHHPRDKKIRGQISTKCANIYGNSMYRYDHEHYARRSSDPVALIVGKRKILQSSETYSQGWKLDGNKRRRRDWIQTDIQIAQGKKIKGKRKWSQEDAELNDVSDIEEGQIITEDANSFKNKFTASVQQAGRALPPPAPQQGTGYTYDDRRISEAVARMERRRERFKEPLGSSK